MTSESTGSVSGWIVGLKASDSHAIQRLWERYYDGLVTLARQKLGQRGPRQVADEEDIALSVFDTICRGAAAGRFGSVTDRDELWWLLLAITHRKVIDHVRYMNREKRGGGAVIRESELERVNGFDDPRGLSRMIGASPSPDEVAMLDEEYHRLLSLLRSEHLQKIAVWRLEGLKVDEIASRIGISKRAVERKLALIRSHWSAEVDLAERAAAAPLAKSRMNAPVPEEGRRDYGS